MLKGGVIMDVTTPEQARIAEEAGACAVMALERIPADISAGLPVFGTCAGMILLSRGQGRGKIGLTQRRDDFPSLHIVTKSSCFWAKRKNMQEVFLLKLYKVSAPSDFNNQKSGKNKR